MNTENTAETIARIRGMAKSPHYSHLPAQVLAALEQAAETMAVLDSAVTSVCAERDEAYTQVDALAAQLKQAHNSIGSASVMLADWDGYYNPATKSGNVEQLALLVEDAYRTLQNGKSWRCESNTQGGV